MNYKIRRNINIFKFLFKIKNLSYILAQFKYNKYSIINNDIHSLIEADTTLLDTGTVIVFVDNKNHKLYEHLIQKHQHIFIVCTYRCYEILKNTNYKLYTITMKQFYDLNVHKINMLIYQAIKDSINLCVDSISIINVGIDNTVEYLSCKSKIVDMWNNLDGRIICSRYIYYMLSKFMCKYFLIEIEKNKKTKEKIEENIKKMKLQLINSNPIMKKINL